MNTTFPFTLCCQLLGVDPKTLRHWLAEASIEPTHPPTDSRLKLLTLEQIYQLAILYRRPITPPADPSGEAQREATLLQEGELSPPRSEEAAMVQQKLTQLEGRLATVCDHLTHLALLLVQQQQRQIALVEPLPHPLEGNQTRPLNANERGTQAQEAPQAQDWQPLSASRTASTGARASSRRIWSTGPLCHHQSPRRRVVPAAGLTSVV